VYNPGSRLAHFDGLSSFPFCRIYPLESMTPSRPPSSDASTAAQPISGLARRIGLPSAVALNMMDMIGVGPFLTLPLVIAAAGSRFAVWAWVLGAAIALCDGLVCAELGAAFPEAGGSYAFLRQIYGPLGVGFPSSMSGSSASPRRFPSLPDASAWPPFWLTYGSRCNWLPSGHCLFCTEPISLQPRPAFW